MAENPFGPSNWSLSSLVFSWLTKDSRQREADEAMKISFEKMDQEIALRLDSLAGITIALQSLGDIAYAQITVKKTTTDQAGSVFDLKSVVVSDWFRQGRQNTSGYFGGGLGVSEEEETRSFAIPLLPVVRASYALWLKNQIAAADPQTRVKLEDCLRRLETKGASVPSFSFLGGACLDILPSGSPPG